MRKKGIKYLLVFAVANLATVSLSARPGGLHSYSVLFDSLKNISNISAATAKFTDDSVSANRDTLLSDSTKVDSVFKDTVDVYEPFIDDPIFGKNKDSLVYDLDTKDVFAWRNGEVEYQDMKLKADYISINTESKNIRAEGLLPSDTTGLADSLKVLSRPVFSQSRDSYEVDSMVYNMDSGKALIKGVNTKQGEGIIQGGTVKKMPDDVIHMHNGTYTVCDAKHPHFYLQMTKGTVIPDKNTVFGPAYMVLEDVPIYFLGVPFGFFPQTRERNSGIIIPEFGEEYVKGFFIRNGGYYFNLGDHFDLKLLGGIYTLGSWQAGLASNYSKRYKYRGTVSFEYASNKIGDKQSPDYVDTRNIALRWSHSMDTKSTRGLNFAASVNYTSSTYNKYQAQNINDYLSSQTSSTISLSKSWTGTPLSFSATASMSQNTRDTTISMNFPTLAFNVARIAPFKRKHAVGKEKWYEKLSFTYAMNFKNDMSNIKEKDFMKEGMFDKMRFGVNHNIPVSASFNVKGWLNITPSFSYQERWYFRSINQNWDDTQNRIVRDTVSGFSRLNNWSAALSANTKLYGTYIVGRKKPIFFRHLFTPSISIAYSPDNGSRYFRSVQTDSMGHKTDYSPWSNELFGVPSRGRSTALSFQFGNTLEGKFHSDYDSTGYKKVKIIESLNISGSYNFIADSMKLSPITVVMSTNIGGKFPITFNAAFDPYVLNENGQRINKYLITNGGFLRLTTLSFSLGYGFQSKHASNNNTRSINNIHNNSNTLAQTALNNQDTFFRQQAEGKEDPRAISTKDMALAAATQYYDFSIPWSVNFSYSFSYSKPGKTANLSQTINLSGNLNLTNKWAISASAGYDFEQSKITPGTVRITRDLHCWQLAFQWVPVGFRQSWSFCLNVKSSMLADLLKWEKRNSFYDNIYGY